MRSAAHLTPDQTFNMRLDDKTPALFERGVRFLVPIGGTHDQFIDDQFMSNLLPAYEENEINFSRQINRIIVRLYNFQKKEESAFRGRQGNKAVFK